MVLSKLVGGICKRFGFSRPIPVRGLYSPDQFQTILARERARADRTGDTFSFVAFNCAAAGNNPDTTASLVRILAGRLRATDDFGWLDAKRIGAVLPGTPAFGARKVAQDVISSFPSARAAPPWQIHCYPTKAPPSKSPWEGRPLGVPVGAGPGNGRAAHPMETFFISPMPAWKRCLDTVGALVGLVLLCPLFAVVAVAVKATSPGPVFFKQMRGGRGGKPFVMYKFRSMINGAEQRQSELAKLNERDGPAFKIQHDPRTTPIGHVLRMTAIDELPQLWNVLKGDMSLVGPRPLPCEESDACQGWHRRRLDVAPGLTCTWQVSGRSEVSFADWARMDIQYIRSQSLWRDLTLIARTVPAVLSGKSAR